MVFAVEKKYEKQVKSRRDTFGTSELAESIQKELAEAGFGFLDGEVKCPDCGLCLAEWSITRGRFASDHGGRNECPFVKLYIEYIQCKKTRKSQERWSSAKKWWSGASSLLDDSASPSTSANHHIGSSSSSMHSSKGFMKTIFTGFKPKIGSLASSSNREDKQTTQETRSELTGLTLAANRSSTVIQTVLIRSSTPVEVAVSPFTEISPRLAPSSPSPHLDRLVPVCNFSGATVSPSVGSSNAGNRVADSSPVASRRDEHVSPQSSSWMHDHDMLFSTEDIGEENSFLGPDEDNPMMREDARLETFSQLSLVEVVAARTGRYRNPLHGEDIATCAVCRSQLRLSDSSVNEIVNPVFHQQSCPFRLFRPPGNVPLEMSVGPTPMPSLSWFRSVSVPSVSAATSSVSRAQLYYPQERNYRNGHRPRRRNDFMSMTGISNTRGFMSSSSPPQDRGQDSGRLQNEIDGLRAEVSGLREQLLQNDERTNAALAQILAMLSARPSDS